MRLKLKQLQEIQTRLEFSTPKEGWLRDIVHHLDSQGYALDGSLRVLLVVTRVDPDYYAEGKLVFTARLNCARCAELYPESIEHPFKLNLVGEAKQLKAKDLMDDPDVYIFGRDEFDLAPVVEEQFHLSLPVQPLCKIDCKGICQQCGFNLNLGKCGCKEFSSNSPFSILKQVKKPKP